MAAESPTVHAFASVLEQRSVSLYETMQVLPVPLDVRALFGTGAAVRVHCELNGQPLERSLIPMGDGVHALWLGLDTCRQLGLHVGDTVHIRLWRADPAAVTIPDELQAALDQDPEAAARWATFAPGRQRGLCLHVSQGKSEATRIRRSLDICHKLRTHTLASDLAAKKQGS